MKEKLLKLLKDPSGVVSRRLEEFMLYLKYRCSKTEYKASEYWKERHKKYGSDLRGVGIEGISSEENTHMYEQAKLVFNQVLDELDIGEDISIADIGCGTGFYAEILKERGVNKYQGFDITDQLFSQLQSKLEQYQFTKLDVTKEDLPNKYDLIMMVDVEQHITDADHFSCAIQNLKKHLKPSGSIILTSWLSKNFVKRSFYEVARPLSAYQKEFEGMSFSQPKLFRDKFIFTIKNNETA